MRRCRVNNIGERSYLKMVSILQELNASEILNGRLSKATCNNPRK